MANRGINRFILSALSVLFLLLLSAQQLFAVNLSEVLMRKLGKSPSRADLIRELKKHLPVGAEVIPEEIIIPSEYVRILYGKKYTEYIDMAQDTNPFLHAESREYGFMVSNELDDFASWEFSPTTGSAFLVPRFEIPSELLQIGYFSDYKKIAPDHIKHMIRRDAKGRQYISFWIHPDDPSAYDDFILGGAKNTPKKGYGVMWDYIGIAPNGPRSLLLISLKNPELDPIMVKVNLHKKLEGSVRIIQPQKAARSVLATRLWQDNISPNIAEKYGMHFMPEIAAWTLPYAKRSNVVRDPKQLAKRNDKYVYAYSAFSPVGVSHKNEILAVKWLGTNPTKEKFEQLARKVFRLMSRPFAYNALVSGLNFEWHSANWALSVTDSGPGDHVLLQDMEALRYDPQVAVWGGGNARALQSVDQPWILAKYSSAIGGNWEWIGPHEKELAIQSPAFLAEEYIWRVRGLKDSKSVHEPTSSLNMWGYSTVVDVVRNFGANYMNFDLTNEEVERWMDEEMADAFNEVLRNELKISEDIVPSVTAEQNLREVMLMKTYFEGVTGAKITKATEKVYDQILVEGGITRALNQYREYLSAKIIEDNAISELQELLADEAERLSAERRNTRKQWSDLDSKKLFFIFHEKSRIIEVRDNEEWLGFFSLEHDGSPATIRFYKQYKKIMGNFPANLEQKYLKTCTQLLRSKNILRRNAGFGDRSSQGNGD